MEFIPLIKIKNRKPAYTNNLLDSIDESKIIYIYDIDGIEKDKPNLCTFQKLSKNHELWVDPGPRGLGDIVDNFMAGASAITIRSRLFPNINPSNIREISENKLYINDDFKKINIDCSLLEEFDGFTLFISREQIDQEYKYRDQLRQYISKNTAYVYESNKDNIYYWKNIGIDNFLVDINKYDEMKKTWPLMQKQ